VSSLELARAFAALVVCGAVAARAGTLVEVTVTGTVEFNGIVPPPLGDAGAGDPAVLRFVVDSSSFVDSVSFPTRGYEIDEGSFSMSFPSTAIGLQRPFPAGQTPFFVLRDNDPAVDGFFLSTLVDVPVGVPLAQDGAFGKFAGVFYVTYLPDTLGSLDILSALGTYDFTGLTVFNFGVEDGEQQPMGILFEELTIALAGAPGEASRQDVPAEQMHASWIPAGQRIQVTYTPACDASGHTIYYGPLAAVSSYGYSGARCAIGTSGSALWVPPAGVDVFFVVAGTDGTREGSYGRDAQGFERPEAVGVGTCDVPQDLAADCQGAPP
jgi:hypothetical protein